MVKAEKEKMLAGELYRANDEVGRMNRRLSSLTRDGTPIE
jgi:hypothetical protein